MEVQIPVDTEAVGYPGGGAAPSALRQRHLHVAAVGQLFERLLHGVFVTADQNDSDVIANGRRVIRVPVGADHQEAVAAEARVLDALTGFGWVRRTALAGGIELELAAEDPLLVLHRFPGAALEVDVRPDLRLHIVKPPTVVLVA